jgi:polar amino acid transport system substrate-binding protein
MKPRSWRWLLVLMTTLSLVAAGCGGDGQEPAAGGETGPAGETAAEDDLLARIQTEGVIRVSTDPAYPPQSKLNEETGEFEGFDIDVAEEIASRLDVEVEWETPAWNAIISGGWSDRWDMSVGSMTVTEERAEVVHFTPAYYYTPASAAIHEDNTTFTDVTTDLDGTRIGVCGACSYDFYLQKNLHIKIPGYEFDYVIDDADIQTYDTDTTAIRDLSLGDGVRLDAVISALPTLEEAIKSGEPIKILGDPLFHEPLAVAFDKSAPLDPTRLVEEVSAIVEEMHTDGTLTELSMKWYGEDLTQSTV